MYRLGSEHASGGAGCVSTVNDYMIFLEEFRTGERLLKRSTIALMATDLSGCCPKCTVHCELCTGAKR